MPVQSRLTPPPAPDAEAIRRALSQADLNALRMALYQVTGDEALARMTTTKMSMRGGAMQIDTLSKAHHAQLLERAEAFLISPGPVPAPPDAAETRGLMELFAGHPLDEREFAFGREELAFEDFPRDVTWAHGVPADRLAGFRVVIVGAGISGLSAAVLLERLKIPYVVIERQAQLGGTWVLNDYPEVRVDVPSHVYQYKFMKNYPWRDVFASGGEHQNYLAHVARSTGVMSRIRFGLSVEKAAWVEADGRWVVELSNGETINANVMISASGLFSTPQTPDIAGIETFAGPMFHTTAWDHEVDLAGKRVALIGTGSSGTQLMPYLARGTAALTVYQRTPNWLSRMEGYGESFTPEQQWLFDNIPFYWNWFSYVRLAAALPIQHLQTHDRVWQANGGRISEGNDKLRASLTQYIEEALEGRPDLIRKCLPDYAPLARRLVVDSGWFEALKRPNVELVVDLIDHVTAEGIVTTDGFAREADVLVLGAGFKVSDYLWPADYVGRDGRTLAEAWKADGARAYLGLTMPDFPNLFMLYGPNGQPRAGSFHSWAEIWSRYAVSGIVQMLESGSTSLACRRDVFDRYNREMDEATSNLIWEQEGRNGYYVNAFGRSGVNMPWLADDYHARVRTLDLADYEVR